MSTTRCLFGGLRRLGLSVSNGGVGPILAAVSCNVRLQLHYPDTVHVGVRISRVGGISFTMEHAVYSVGQQAIAADGNSTLVVFDYQTNRPRRISDDLRAAATRAETAGAMS